jgi:hypothetical protein
MKGVSFCHPPHLHSLLSGKNLCLFILDNVFSAPSTMVSATIPPSLDGLINLFQALAFRFNPPYRHDDDNNNVPRTVDEVHFPADVRESDWHDEHEKQPVQVVSFEWRQFEMAKDIRSSIQENLENTHSVRSDGIMQNFWRIKVEDRCPSDAVSTLE